MAETEKLCYEQQNYCNAIIASITKLIGFVDKIKNKKINQTQQIIDVEEISQLQINQQQQIQGNQKLRQWQAKMPLNKELSEFVNLAVIQLSQQRLDEQHLYGQKLSLCCDLNNTSNKRILKTIFINQNHLLITRQESIQIYNLDQQQVVCSKQIKDIIDTTFSYKKYQLFVLTKVSLQFYSVQNIQKDMKLIAIWDQHEKDALQISVSESEEKIYLLKKNKLLKSLSKYTGKVEENYEQLNDTPTCLFIESEKRQIFVGGESSVSLLDIGQKKSKLTSILYSKVNNLFVCNSKLIVVQQNFIQFFNSDTLQIEQKVRLDNVICSTCTQQYLLVCYQDQKQQTQQQTEQMASRSQTLAEEIVCVSAQQSEQSSLQLILSSTRGQLLKYIIK